MSKVTFKLEDYSKESIEAIQKAAVKALTKVGLVVESSAKTKSRWDTNQMRDSIDHKVIPNGSKTVVYVGTNDNKAPFHEFGSGEFAENNQGRKGYWVYVKGEGSSQKTKTGKTYTLQQAKQIMAILRSKGLEAYYTKGIKAQPFLRPAFRENKEVAQQLIAETFRKEFGR